MLEIQKDKLYHILNEKLFDIADLLLEIFIAKLDKVCPPENGQKARNDAWFSCLSGRYASWNNIRELGREVWKTYLKEMGITGFVRSGWFKENDMEDGIESLSFADLQGQKVDVEWIKENLVIIQDPLLQFHKVGVPKELAIKAMVLGYFPDSSSIQEKRESAKVAVQPPEGDDR